MQQDPITTEDINLITEVLTELFAKVGTKVEIHPEQTHSGDWVFNLNTEFPRMLIGKQGSILQAFQTLAIAIVNKKLNGKRVYFSLDVDDYKRKREWYLKQAAKAAVEQVKFSRQPVRMEPLPHYERRFVHEYLQNNFPEISSDSQGYDPNRYIVVSLL
jgi:predicted RNA-binding protein Jag